MLLPKAEMQKMTQKKQNSKRKQQEKNLLWDFRGGLVFETSPSSAGEVGSILG